MRGLTSRSYTNPSSFFTRSLERGGSAQVDAKNSNFNEVIMGHRLSGSGESYFDRNYLKELTDQNMKIDFSREIHESEMTMLRNEVKDLRAKLGKATEEKEYRKKSF